MATRKKARKKAPRKARARKPRKLTLDQRFERYVIADEHRDMSLRSQIEQLSTMLETLIMRKHDAICIVWGTATVVGLRPEPPKLDPLDVRLLDAVGSGEELEKIAASLGSGLTTSLVERATEKRERIAREEFLRSKEESPSANICAEPAILHVGDKARFTITPQMAFSDFVIRVNEPFVMEDVLVGPTSVMAASRGATREVKAHERVHVGQLITVHVSYPSFAELERNAAAAGRRSQL